MKDDAPPGRWLRDRIRDAQKLARTYREDGATHTAAKLEGRVEAFKATLLVIDAEARRARPPRRRHTPYNPNACPLLQADPLPEGESAARGVMTTMRSWWRFGFLSWDGLTYEDARGVWIRIAGRFWWLATRRR